MMPAHPITHRVLPQFSHWLIDHSRFEIKRVLGKGSYGSVVEAHDHLTGKRVAIKKISSLFDVSRLFLGGRGRQQLMLQARRGMGRETRGSRCS